MADLRFCAYQYQRPRPPVTIAAHGSKMLYIATQHGDGWRSWGGYDAETEPDFYAVTSDRSHRFDDLRAPRGGGVRGNRGHRHAPDAGIPLMKEARP